MIRRPPRSTRVRSSAASDVYKRQVYLLGDPEPIDGLADLDPSCYGVIVEGPGGRRGLLLPAIPGISSAAEQVDIARRKAALSPGDPILLSRFTAEIIR